MISQRFLIALLLLSSPALAQCPQMEGTFLCRGPSPFEISVHQTFQGSVPSYVMTDPTAERIFIPDQQFHEMELKEGRGRYRAWCAGNRLNVEVQSPRGERFTDQYYIERSALVRVRIAQPRPSSLSCAPTRGTWRNYQR